ncbi:MAG: hypothetical protein GC186_15230 [Rhodobacteraceae bacterium]|nr:hypothetical protein [Paracoccaceae bacterium]
MTDIAIAAAPVEQHNRVPAVTVDFWLIKLMAVTVGETFADLLNTSLELSLSQTSLLFGGLFGVMLWGQFAQRRYVPAIYWSAVVMISVVGTLITDNLTDGIGVPLLVSTVGFSLALGATFWLWYRSEGSLSIHTIMTARREAWYWLAILFTFALGTAAGDLVAESFALGYLQTGVLFAAIIAAIAFGHFVLKLDGILAFWLAYILTRPLGASFGDLLAQPTENGGLGLGTVVTSFLFLAAIAGIVIYMTVRHYGYEKDVLVEE